MQVYVVAIAENDECSSGLNIPNVEIFSSKSEVAKFIEEDYNDTIIDLFGDETDDYHISVKLTDIKDGAEWDTPHAYDDHWVKWKVFVKNIDA